MALVGDEPLIGAAEMETPYWARSQLEASQAGIWRWPGAPRGRPRADRLVVAGGPALTLLAIALQLATAVATAFGLLSTVDVFTNPLAAVPTPQRVVDALPALAVVVGALVARGALQAASRSSSRHHSCPRVEQGAQDDFYARLADVELGHVRRLPDFAALVQAGRSRRWYAPALRRVARSVTWRPASSRWVRRWGPRGLLQPVLAPVVLLAGAPPGCSRGARRAAADGGERTDRTPTC